VADLTAPQTTGGPTELPSDWKFGMAVPRSVWKAGDDPNKNPNNPIIVHMVKVRDAMTKRGYGDTQSLQDKITRASRGQEFDASGYQAWVDEGKSLSEGQRARDVEESLADEFMKMAQARGFNVRQAGTPEQERQRSLERLAQRKKEQEEKQRQNAQADFEQLSELKAKYQEMRDLYKSLGGSDWQYADREQNLTDRERQARGMENELSILAGRIKRAEQLKEQSGLGFGEAKHEEKIAGRYDPDDFDLMVKRLGQRAREQQKSRPVDVQDLARKLRAIEQSKDEK
jgi:hypothetical protein